jgi:hypothetical protein
VIVLNVILQEAINPALKLLPDQMDSDAARVMLLAIGLQESRFNYTFQKVAGNPYVKGPAKGYWQFEEGGGVKGVMKHPTTAQTARNLCEARDVPFESKAINYALETDHVLSSGFARLLLWTDAKPLPNLDASHQVAWDLYARTWRPGHPRRESWDEFHAQARAQVLA